MNGFKSLSGKERHQQFFYLVLLAFIALVIMCRIFLSGFSSPFHDEISFEMRLLEQQKRFVKQEKNAQPFLEKTFAKINSVPYREIQAFVANDIKNSITDISNIQYEMTINDPRKANYQQIADFYTMFFEDKTIAGKKMENIDLFEKQFTACGIGFKDKEQQLAQKNAIISSRIK